MSLKTISYGSLSFPCSRYGKRELDNAYEADMHLSRSDISVIATLRRPTSEKIRFGWMKRFLNEMHWLPLIEVLAACDQETNPKRHAAFLSALKKANPLRVCHRPWGRREASFWAGRLRRHVKATCPDTRILDRVRPCLNNVDNGGDVFFIGPGFEPVATQMLPTDEMWRLNSWAYYRHTRIEPRELTADERKACIFGALDPADAAAAALIKTIPT
jgi:hypothetical protein